jgi:hypothetical protein
VVFHQLCGSLLSSPYDAISRAELNAVSFGAVALGNTAARTIALHNPTHVPVRSTNSARPYVIPRDKGHAGVKIIDMRTVTVDG